MDESEVLKFERQEVIKLSQAIREGVKLRPQCRKHYFINDKSCAIGAAMEARGIDIRHHLYDRPYEMLGISQYLHDQIVMWNDRDHITRETIADRLESIGY